MWMMSKTLSTNWLACGDTCSAAVVSFWPHTSGFASGIVLCIALCGFLTLSIAISVVMPRLQLLTHSASGHAKELFAKSDLRCSKKVLGPEYMSAIQSTESASIVTPHWPNCLDSISVLSVTLVGFPRSCPKTGCPSTSVGQRASKIRSRMSANTESRINEQTGCSES